MSDGYDYPTAISRFSGDSDTHDEQVNRAIDWILAQPGFGLVVVTPRRDIPNRRLAALVKAHEVEHLTWKVVSPGSYEGQRVLLAWPSRTRLQETWGAGARAVAVIEWSEAETADWVAAARPVLLLADGVFMTEPGDETRAGEALPNGIDRILEHVVMMSAGYSSGLKWNEEEQLKSNMMLKPERWAEVTVLQVRARCLGLGMSPQDADTVAALSQRRKDGRRFIVHRNYRGFAFLDDSGSGAESQQSGGTEQ